MADTNRLMASPATDYDVDTQTNAIATATLAAPGAGFAWVIAEATVSMTAAPATAIAAVLNDGATAIKTVQISANAFSPIPLVPSRGFKASPNTAVSLVLPASGTGGVVGTATIAAFKVAVS